MDKLDLLYFARSPGIFRRRDRNNTYISTMKGGLKSSQPPCFPVSNVGQITDPPSSVPKRASQAISIHKAKQIVQVSEKYEPVSRQPSLSIFSKEVIEPMRNQIKSGIPLLDHREIRRVRLPFSESILQDLKEDGYYDAEQYIRYLIDLDENQRITAGPQNIISRRPPLISSNKILKKLVEGFKKGDITKNAEVLLKVGLEFAKEPNRDWYWLAEDILSKAVEVASRTDPPNEKIHAIVLHVNAEFLLEKLSKVYEAEAQLIKSMKLSSARIWTCKTIYGTESDLLYVESCFLLHKAYLIQAREFQKTDVRKCIELCSKAKNLAFKTKNDSAKENTMVELIEAYIMADDDKSACYYIEQYLSYCRERNNTKGLCKALLQQSTLLLKEKNTAGARDTLNQVIEEATEGHHKYLCAVAHQRLVQLSLQEENMTDARNNAALAYKIFTELNAIHELEEMRCFSGITLGLETLPYYESILFNSINIDDNDFDSFIQWKTSRKRFYPDMKLIQPETERIVSLERQHEQAKEEEALYLLMKVTESSTILTDSQMSDRQTILSNAPQSSFSSDRRRIQFDSLI